jgi:hypothetical protein
MYSELWRVKKPDGFGFTPYRQSYTTYVTFNLQPKHFAMLTHNGQNGGWLVDLLPGKPEVDYTIVRWVGRYRRLTFDGSVITRTHRDVVGRNGTGQSSVLKFGDFSPEEEISIGDRGRL